ncbi:MAG: hypothetical protein J6J36_07145 [Clostridia bacterium]|nr:hypothetical protein [Clostridia bacterium]
MNFEDCKAKIQKVSDLIENSKYPEDILNSKEIDFNTEFQYLCLNSSVNSDLVNEVIARLAQNGNREIVEQNIKNITIGMWKDLFEKNNTINDIFIKNYDVIIQNTGIITYREIENFIDNESTLKLIYNSMPYIIRKLCTYDRAALITKLSTKEDGVTYIKENITNFFKKGEYDISTTYSKVLIELNNIPEISKLEILEACNPHLSEMLERETAIDNETNDLLNWIYDSMEETKMFNEQRADLQENIDNAILDNFDHILDKSNYDKTTIKILKQFPCTFEKFDNNKNLFIEKSNKLIHMTKIYDLNYEKDNKRQAIEDLIDNSENIVRLSDNCGHIQDFSNQKNCSEMSNIVKNNNFEQIQEDIKHDNMIYDEKNEKLQQNQKEPFKELDELKMIEDLTKLIDKNKEFKDKNEGQLINELIMNNIKDTNDIINRVLGKYQNNATENDSNNQQITDNLNYNMDETKKFKCLESKFDAHFQNETTKKYNVQAFNNNENETVVKKQDITDEQHKEETTALTIKENEIGSARMISFFKKLWNKIKRVFMKFKTDRIGE